MSLQPITVGVNGASGRMGKRVIALLSAEPGMKLAAALVRAGHPTLGRDAGAAAGVADLGVPLTERPEGPFDVLIDFSTPDATLRRLTDCVRDRTAVVVGTTGLEALHMERLRTASRTIPVLYAPNMSLGVNLLFKMVGAVAKVLGGYYDVEIVEAHHRHKKDAPSGTALKLAEEIGRALGYKMDKSVVYGRHGQVGERVPDQIAIHAVRGGDIVGEHTVVFAGLGDRFEITHRAHSRDTFARGAIRAARFLAGAKPGWYAIEEALGVKAFGT